jgi:KDO2-lipid IV(A) lauroyltransferase
MVSYYLYLLTAYCLRHFPRAVSEALTRVITFFFFLSRKKIRNNVRNNLEILCVDHCRPYTVFHNFSRTITDFLALSPDRSQELDQRCEIRGIENLDTALEKGRGVILFSAHHGPWEYSGACLSSKGYRLNTIAREHPSARVTEFFSSRRSAWGIKVYPTGERVGRLIEALRKGEIVVLLIDRRFSTKGVQLDFLGRKVSLPWGHVILSQRTGAALLPCCCYYEDSGSVSITIGCPVESRGTSIRQIAQECINRIEDHIRAKPEQWFAFDHLWPEVRDE